MIAPLFTIVLLASAFAATAPSAARIGDLIYDAGEWQVEQNGVHYDVRFRKYPDETGLTVTLELGAPSACSTETMARETESLADRSFKTIAKPGADIHVVTAWLGCRNARPPTVHACAAYRGRIYRFDAIVLGCNGGPGFTGDALQFLEELSLP